MCNFYSGGFERRYMKKYVALLRGTAVSYGCRPVDEYLDEENEITKVFGITREEWKLCNKL